MKKIITNDLMFDIKENFLESIASPSGSDLLDATTLDSMISVKPWDKAHFKKSESDVEFAEPNLNNDNIYVSETTTFPDRDSIESLESLTDVCTSNNDFEENWPFPKDHRGQPIKSIWHLGDNYSQLKSARDKIEAKDIVRIAHFDTGYDPTHSAFNRNLINDNLERNFVEPNLPRRAIDNYSQGRLKNPGHGPGTMSILAGNVINLPEYNNFNDSIGLSKGIEIVPIRLAESVVLFKSSNFVKALDYIISIYDNPATRCHIVTMSMGGLASKAWADVVNRAYEKGIFIVTAAGNNFGGITPRTTVYPARFKRVVAACGVTFDYSPYYRIDSPIKVMQGNFGPRKVMNTAIAAFTPNMPWAKIGCKNTISLAGAGTSSATPQIAAAAALYYQKYFDEIEGENGNKKLAGWQKVEIIRRALFSSAKKQINGFDNDVELYFGNGVLQADTMLNVAPLNDLTSLTKMDEDKVSWALWKLLTGSQLESMESLESFQSANDESALQMYEIEIVQLLQKNMQLQHLLSDEEKEIEDLSLEDQQRFINIILNMPEASENLKMFLSPRLNKN